MKPLKPLILALDVETDREALSLVKATKDYIDIFKVGPGLILKYGPHILKKIQGQGRKIFLDLKFHDIPNTMLRAVNAAGAWKVHSTTVHISAGETSLRTLSEAKSRPLLWGVTVLTSLTSEDLNQLGFQYSTLDQVVRLGTLAKRLGLDGLVASVGETAELRKILGSQFTIITPGIRLIGNETQDQKRVATPAHARLAGATYIVVGRPILESRYPAEVAKAILKEWDSTAK